MACLVTSLTTWSCNGFEARHTILGARFSSPTTTTIELSAWASIVRRGPQDTQKNGGGGQRHRWPDDDRERQWPCLIGLYDDLPEPKRIAIRPSTYGPHCLELDSADGHRCLRLTTRRSPSPLEPPVSKQPLCLAITRQALMLSPE